MSATNDPSATDELVKPQRASQRPALNTRSIEPMILMSASPMESGEAPGESGDEPTADFGLDGETTEVRTDDATIVDLSDTLPGEPLNIDGSVRLLDVPGSGGLIDMSAVTSESTIDLTTGELQLDGNTINTGAATAVWGGEAEETFAFSGPKADVDYVVIGNSGNDSIDLSQYDRDQIEISDGAIRGPAGDGQFNIYFADVAYVELADGTEALPQNDLRWPEEIADDIRDSINYEIDQIGEPDFIDDSLENQIVGTDLRDVLRAASGDNVVLSLDGNDTIVTGDGDDQIHAGSGNDWIQAGAGADVIDGGDGQDRIAHWDSTEGVHINLQTQTVSGGYAEGDVISSIEQAVGSNHDDVIIGSDGNNGFLRGGAGDDVIDGGAGNDRLMGDEGADVLRGGEGRDTVDYSSSQEGVSVDLQNQTATGGDATGDQISGFENVRATRADDQIRGSDENNTIRTFDGDDQIHAGDGNDWIQAGAGADMIHGGDGQDRIAHWDSTAGVNINLQTQTVSGGYAEGDMISSIEQAVGSNHDDVIIGSDGNNGFLRGGAGDDVIDGGAGNDRLMGDQGADVMRGGEGRDTVDYSSSKEGVTVDLENQTATGGDATGDQISGFEDVRGSRANDVITGSSGSNTIRSLSGDDVINAGDGNDWIQAGAGADVIDGGEGQDRIAHWDSTEGVNVNLQTQTVSGGSAEGDTISSIEQAVGSNHDDVIIGSDGDNGFLRGGGGNDVIDGLGGDDYLMGDAGDDVMDGGSGDDVINAGVGNDVIQGGEGQDTAIFAGPAASYAVTLSGDQMEVAQTTTGDVNSLSSIETLKFGNGVVSVDDLQMFGNAPEDMTITAGASTNLPIDLPSSVSADQATVTITGVPAHSILTVGTVNPDGSWTVSGEDVESIELRTPTNFAGPIQLQMEVDTSMQVGSDDALQVKAQHELEVTVDVAADPANLIANGSFEDVGDQTNNAGWGLATGDLPGWTLEEGSRFEVVDDGHRNVDATDGDHWLDMDASPGNITISQEVLGLDNGTVYELSFDALATPGREAESNGLDIFWNGEKVGEVGSTGDSQIITVRAGDGDGTNQLTFAGTGRANGYGLSLDNVRLVESENLLVNGSFENVTGMTDAGWGLHATETQGWTIDNPSNGNEEASGNRFESHRPRGGVEATDGNYWMDMGGSPGNLTMSQQVPGVTDGESYVLSFDLADSSHDATDGLDVIWNGEVIASITDQDNTMDRFEFQVEGGTGDSSNTLTFRGTGDANNFGVSLDNVELVAGEVELIDHEPRVAELQINATNLNEMDGVRVFAQRVDSSGAFVESAELVSQADGKFGVVGTVEGGVLNQIGMNAETGIAEQVVMEFENEVTSASFTFTNLFKGEGDARGGIGDEQGKWEAWHEGEMIATGVFTASQANHRGEVQIELPEGQTADRLTFTPTEYSGGQNGSTIDSSDFFLTSVTATTMDADAAPVIETSAGIAVDLGLELTDLASDDNASIHVAGVPEGSVLSAGNRNPDGTWTLSHEEAAGLKIRTPNTFAGEISLDVQVTNTSDFAPNLVVNGSFESAVDTAVASTSERWSNTTRGWGVFDAIEGWTSTGEGSGLEVQQNVAGAASDGNSLVELDSHQNSGMYQDIPTRDGQNYVLNIDYSPRPRVDAESNAVEVYYDGQLLGTLTGDGSQLANTQWSTHRFEVEATGETGRLELRAAGTSDSLGGYVDNVVMQFAVVDQVTMDLQVAASADPDNFIANGSFEDLTGLQSTGFGHMGEQLNGWQIEEGPRFEVHNPRHGVDQADHGDYWLDMDASPGNMTISQDVLGLEEGKVYELSFATANSNPFVHRGELLDTTTNGLEVFWNGEKISEVLSEDAEFTDHQVSVRSGSGDGTDRLTFRGLGNEDNVGISLDNIRMIASDNLLVDGSLDNVSDTPGQGWTIEQDVTLEDTTLDDATLIAQEDVPQPKEDSAIDDGFRFEREGLAEFLGQLADSSGEQSISRTFELSGRSRFAVVEFDLVQPTSWLNQGAPLGSQDAVNVFINDSEVIAFQPGSSVNDSDIAAGTDWNTGASDDIRYTITPDSLDGSYKVRLEILDPGEAVKFGLGSTLDPTLTDDGFNIDNLSVYEAGLFETTLNANGAFQVDVNETSDVDARAELLSDNNQRGFDNVFDSNSIAISQEVPGVVNGQDYSLTFEIPEAARNSGDELQVIWNEEVVAHLQRLDPLMDRVELKIRGGSGDGSNTLRFIGTVKQDHFGIALDHVTLTQAVS